MKRLYLLLFLAASFTGFSQKTVNDLTILQVAETLLGNWQLINTTENVTLRPDDHFIKTYAVNKDRKLVQRIGIRKNGNYRSMSNYYRVAIWRDESGATKMREVMLDETTDYTILKLDSKNLVIESDKFRMEYQKTE